MSNQYSQIIILCEDRQHEVFIRTFVEKYYNISSRRLLVRPFPNGRGSASDYVQKQFPKEIKAFRSRNYLNIALIIMIDADTYSCEQRLKQLSNILQQSKLNPLNAEERIAIFVPKWNIETWIEYLKNNNVNETTKYPHISKQKEAKPLTKKLAEDCLAHIDLPDDAPDSLQRACEELKKIPRTK